MIDTNEPSGRFLAHAMYGELEKIARYSSALRGRTLDEIVDQGARIQRQYAKQPSMLKDYEMGLRGFKHKGTPQRKVNKALREARQASLDDIAELQARGRNLIEIGTPTSIRRGQKLIEEAARARKQILSGVTGDDLLEGTARAAAPAAASAKAGKSSMGQKFDRLANLTGKGVLGAGAVGGGVLAYQAAQPKSPYSGY